jgi:hypothetical protein
MHRRNSCGLCIAGTLGTASGSVSGAGAGTGVGARASTYATAPTTTRNQSTTHCGNAKCTCQVPKYGLGRNSSKNQTFAKCDKFFHDSSLWNKSLFV